MPRTSAQARYEAQAQTEAVKQAYIDELTVLFMNSVTIDNLPENVYPTFILKQLLYYGKVGKMNDMYFRLVPNGTLDQYGRPSRYNLLTGNNICYAQSVKPEKIAILRANKICFPYYSYFEKVATQLAIMDNSINVNLINSQTSWLLMVEDEPMANTIKQAYEDMAIGLPAIVATKRSVGDVFADTKNIAVQFVADKIKALHTQVWDEALKRCGIMTSNDFKRERVQTAEVNAGVGETIDYIYAMIDTFNQDAEAQGIPERMRFTGYTAEYDAPEEEQPDGKKQPENDNEAKEGKEDEQHV